MGKILVHSAYDFESVLELGGFNRGDTLDQSLVNIGHFDPVLVLNDSNYLDVEYLFQGICFTKEEIQCGSFIDTVKKYKEGYK